MSSIKNSNLDYYKVVNQLTQAITQLNSNHKIDVHNVYGSSSISNSIEDKRLITITNPERLNTNDTLIIGEWGITYGGRDLTLDNDNYCWIVTNRKSGVKGFYIVERELINGDWLNVRWGKTPTLLKSRKEVIDKSRLRDKDMIQRDMVIAVMNSK